MAKWITIKLPKKQAEALLLAAEIGTFERLDFSPDRQLRKDAKKAFGKLREAVKKEA